MQPSRRCSLLLALVLLGPEVLPGQAAQDPPRDLRKEINAAKARDPAIPAQAAALARLAWPGDATLDPPLQAEARRELVGFAHHALGPLRRAFGTIPRVYQADAASAFVEARYRVAGGLPPEFLAGIVDFIWSGPPEAQRIAMAEAGRYRYLPAMLPIIDAATMHPEIALTAVRTLGRIGNEKASHFLSDALHDPSPEFSIAAAEALARIGSRGAAVLQEASRSDDPNLRRTAIRALVPVANPNDITVLHEYLGRHGDDDPATVSMVRAKAEALELLIEEFQTDPEFREDRP